MIVNRYKIGFCCAICKCNIISDTVNALHSYKIGAILLFGDNYIFESINASGFVVYSNIDGMCIGNSNCTFCFYASGSGSDHCRTCFYCCYSTIFGYCGNIIVTGCPCYSVRSIGWCKSRCQFERSPWFQRLGCCIQCNFCSRNRSFFYVHIRCNCVCFCSFCHRRNIESNGLCVAPFLTGIYIFSVAETCINRICQIGNRDSVPVSILTTCNIPVYFMVGCFGGIVGKRHIVSVYVCLMHSYQISSVILLGNDSTVHSIHTGNST